MEAISELLHLTKSRPRQDKYPDRPLFKKKILLAVANVLSHVVAVFRSTDIRRDAFEGVLFKSLGVWQCLSLTLALSLVIHHEQG